MLHSTWSGGHEAAGISCTCGSNGGLAADGVRSRSGPARSCMVRRFGQRSQMQRRHDIVRDALRELGWIDGRNVRLNRSSMNAEQNRAVVAEIAALSPSVILTSTAPVLAAAHRQTKTVPIVFIQVTDPVSDGFVESLARPGGNVTGFTIFEHSFAGKWLEMLKEVVPAMTRVAVIRNSDHPAWNAYLNAIREVASRMAVEVTPAPVRNADEVEAALAAFGQQPNGGVILLPSALVTTNRELIAALTLRYRLPSIYIVRLYPVSGGLMSYGVDIFAQVREARTTSTASSRGQSQANCQCRPPANSRWYSISRPRRHLASLSRKLCWAAPTR